MCYYILPKNYNNCIIKSTLNNKIVPLYTSHSSYNYYNSSIELLMDLCLNNREISFETASTIINTHSFIFNKIPNINISVSKCKYNTSTFYDFIEIVKTFNVFELSNRLTNALVISKNMDNSAEFTDFFTKSYKNVNFNFIDNYDDANLQLISKYEIMFYDTNINNQDLNSYVLNLVNFLLCAFNCQEENGTSIIKIININHKPIVDVLVILTSIYNDVYVIKPITNNILSLDRYVVCKGFIYNSKKINLYSQYYHTLKKIYNNGITNNNIQSIIENEISCFFTTKLNNMNILMVQQQLETINYFINLFKNINRDEKMENIKKINIQKCVQWCEKNKVTCNKYFVKQNIFASNTSCNFQKYTRNYITINCDKPC